MANTPSHLLCVVLIIILSSMSCSASRNPPKKKHSLFVFGDSLFDAGNNQYFREGSLSGTTWPYGETFFGHPTGRLSDGRIVPDFIAQFASLPILPPYLKPGNNQFIYGANFASAGSRVLSSNNFSINLEGQVNYFKDVIKTLNRQLGAAGARKLLNSAVYLFSAGGNDYFSLFRQNPNASQAYQEHYVKMVVSNLTNTLQEIYSLGGRKIAFQNAGYLGCVPISRAHNAETGGGCTEFLSSLTRQHNRLLSVELKKLERTLPGFKHAIFDYYAAMEQRDNKPLNYGFKVHKAACCGTGYLRSSGCGGGSTGQEEFEVCKIPAEYLWFDGSHTTEKANLQLARLMWDGPPSITGPLTVKQLFGCD